MKKILISLILSIGLLVSAPISAAAKNPHTATLTLSSNSFIWAGPPALSHYTVWFCDGTTTEKIDINGKESETTELSFDKQIAKVTAKGGTQWETKEQSCQTEQKQEENNDEEKCDEHDEENNEETSQTNDTSSGGEESHHEDISRGGPSDVSTVPAPVTLADTGPDYALILALAGISLISLSLVWIRKNPRD